MHLEERVRALFIDAGSILNIFVIDEHSQEHFWHIALDEETIFFAEIDQERGLLVLSCDVGSPPRTNREAFYATVLTYAHHANKTSGARLSLAGPHGPVWLWMEIAIDVLDRQLMAGVLTDYKHKIAAWKQAITRASAQVTHAEPDENLFMRQGFMRG